MLVRPGPPCPAPGAEVVEAAALGQTRDGLSVLARVKATATVSLKVRLTTATGTRIETAWLVVAVPGATMAAGDPRDLPATAWVLPKNQAARIPIAADRVSAVSFVPPRTGRFTVFADVYSRGSADCRTSPPPQAALGEGQIPLGVIDVRG